MSFFPFSSLLSFQKRANSAAASAPPALSISSSTDRRASSKHPSPSTSAAAAEEEEEKEAQELLPGGPLPWPEHQRCGSSPFSAEGSWPFGVE